eukprot:gene7929-9755_t
MIFKKKYVEFSHLQQLFKATILIYLYASSLIISNNNGGGVVESITVLSWSGFSWAGWGQNPFNTPNYVGQNINKEICPVECNYIGDKKKASEADAILFEAQPFANYGYLYLKTPPAFPQKQVNQKFINFGYEHDAYFPISGDQGYLKHIDVNATYSGADGVQVTFACSWGSYDNGSIEEFRNPPLPISQKIPRIVFMASNCYSGGAIYRTCYIKEMMKHIKIDSLGECMHNLDLKPEDNDQPLFKDLGKSLSRKRRIMSQYKFSLAFENNNKTDYVTEKVFTSLLSGSLPIYMGAPNIDEWIPEKSVVKTDDFKSPQELVKYLHYLDKNDTAYNEYFEWKKKPYSAGFLDKYSKCVFYSAECRLCQHLQKLIDQEKPLNHGHRESFGEPENIKSEKRVLAMNSKSCLTIHQNDTISTINGNFTISAWINSETISDKNIFTIQNYGQISLHSVWKRSYVRFCYLKSKNCFIGETPILANDWRHIAVTVTAQSTEVEILQIYVNGKLDISFTSPSRAYFASANFLVGCDNSFEGKIDDLVVWRIGLSPAEIGHAMFKKYRGNEYGMITYFTFNDPNSITDYSTHRARVDTHNVKTEESDHRNLELGCC